MLRGVLKRRFHLIPHCLYIDIIREMEELRLIKRYGNTKNIKYELTGGDVDKELNLSLPIQ